VKSFYPVIVAGGRGTRFWPLSRARRAKQLLPLAGTRTMIQQTAARLRALAPARNFWVITNRDLRPAILQQLPTIPKKQIVAEPVQRNTAPAIGLAAFILQNRDPDAVIGMFPADHVIGDEKRFRGEVQRAIEIAQAGPNIVVMGIKPSRPETGYGYIELGAEVRQKSGDHFRVHRFREKPNLETAQQFLEAGNFLWNSGMFVWRAATLAGALQEHLPATAIVLEQIASRFGARDFEATLGRQFPRAENISIDYAVLEPRSAKGEQLSGLFCIPADYGWNDLGSWTALHEHKLAVAKSASAKSRATRDRNVIESAGHVTLDAGSNYIHAPKKFVAAVGVEGLVIVETDDALLITTLAKSQEVGKVVKHLDEKKRKDLT
jgi:mannose-1-phosphate guanylyltransferase